jgi:protoporphyrinogen oxidase
MIDSFLYPKLGPGQMWEEAARSVIGRGGTILHHRQVIGLRCEGKRVVAVRARNTETGEESEFSADFVFSTMPVRELVAGLDPQPPESVREVAGALQYRDFITVGLLTRHLSIGGQSDGQIADSWLYIQEPGFRMGRLQIFNNWSPWLLDDPKTYWLGLEYFCSVGDEFWSKSDESILDFARDELVRMGFAEADDILDGHVLRMEKAYPAYHGAYEHFDLVRNYLDRFENLFLIGRNGMHKYNNQDHSMLTAMVAVDNIAAGVTGKENIWAVNAEEEYHESGTSQT